MYPLLIILAAAEPATPRTVNGQALGTAEKFTTAGPTRVCLSELMVTALPNESVTLLYSGIHAGQLRLNRGSSWVDLGVGESSVQPRGVGDVIERRPDAYVADISDNIDLRYGVFWRDEEGKYRLTVKIEGPGLSGDQNDRSILRRIQLRRNGSPPCAVTYNYGWGVILGEEPLIEKPHQ